MSLRIRRGTDAQRTNPGITPDQGELIYTTDTKKLFIGDGSTLGGVNIGQSLAGTGLVFDTITQTLQATAQAGNGGISSVSSDLNPSLGGNLNLNNKNITGTGTIGIVGTMYASQGLGGDLSLNTHSITGTGNIAISGTVSVAGLGADLVLNNHNITGTGNISTTGTLSVTGLGADLVLNNHNITGTGNINTTGTISSTGTCSASAFNSSGALTIGSISTTGTLSAGATTLTSTLSAGASTLTSVTTAVVNVPDASRGLQISSLQGNGIAANFYAGSSASPTTLGTGSSNSMTFALKGYNGSTYVNAGVIISYFDNGANLSDVQPKSNLVLSTGGGGTTAYYAGFTSLGILTAPGFHLAGPNYATQGTIGYNGSGNYPSPAQAGMMIFDSSNNHFYGYNGTTWKQLDN